MSCVLFIFTVENLKENIAKVVNPFLIRLTWPTCCFRDKGMRYIVGKDWRDLFDVVIVQAEKPSFFNDKRR